MNFSEAKIHFDKEYSNVDILDKSIVTVDGKYIKNIKLKDTKGKANEEYYKWQFIYSLINSKKYPRDHIGTEIYFPKGNKNSAPIKIDAVIFNSIEWIDYYRDYRENNNVDSLDKLREMAIVVIEFKRDDKKIEQVFSSQIRASIKEPNSKFVLGIYYDAGRLFLFKRINDEITRFENSKNIPKSQRILEKFQLELTDPYYMIPSLDDINKILNSNIKYDKSKLKVEDLDIVYTINDENIKNSLSNILRMLESVSLFNEEGYLILIQLIAMKIFDEKQSELHGSFLRFYKNEMEVFNDNLNSAEIRQFIDRMKDLYGEARRYYRTILSNDRINWAQERHVKVALEIVSEFEKYSFVKSRKSDLYQLVFYNFATKFKKDENAQFLTPLPIIDFIVNIVNPRRNETVCDPCCGSGDFLSVSYVNSGSKLDDRNLFGFDNDYNMTVLAQLNMLLNGDGNAIIKYFDNKGSINQKLSIDSTKVKLNLDMHKSGNWDEWNDETELMKYDVIMTNPPFGKGRSLDLNKAEDIEVAKLYELYDLYVKNNPKTGLDLGVVFLENTVRCLKENGRFAIVLSNSLVSNNTWPFIREWLMDRIRIVALFDLPSNVFAETGVNTTIIVGYKPNQKKLDKLKKDDYSVFVREIENVGYIKRTSKRNVIFEKDYKLDEETFETIIDSEGNSILNEDFTKYINEFKEWCLFQESDLKKLFLE
ncbi:HsdM family class I SAM-dependent methyltransferase [Paraclostridium bifermentans]|uniref:HsdM family class I SAM-dependent methyltransferase n=1 Tax=Paraclostridium bifermentans TaxID=1490 RepID=UPI00189A3253|nr:N-6 DNA methylase [Paraclostridium bifermentans]